MYVPMSTLTVEAPTARETPSALPFWRRALAFGTGFGIAIGERNLEAAIVRARPSGATPIATTTIHDFRNRPAAEWGAELLRFVTAAGETRLAATVLLPRNEVVVRTVSLPGVADKDAANAIDLQTDALHPWSDPGGRDVEVAWGWSRASKDDVIVGLARKDVLDSYETLFAEAGIPMAAATFSPAVIHAALRIWSPAPASLLCIGADENGRTEIYGESESRAVFSAEFSIPRERALALARAELRMAPGHPATALSEVLPRKVLPRALQGTPGTELSGSPLAYAAAIAGSAPRVAHFANLLPPERRASHDRVQYLVPAALGILLVLGLLTVFVIFPAVEQKRYREDLDRAARQLEPAAARAQAVERKIKENAQRILVLDEIRRRPQDDLEVLNELTRLLPPPVWTSSVEIYPDSVVISGEADQAAPLLKVLDSSPLFQNSEFALSLTRGAQTEQFRIKTIRRGRAGRTTS
jgi:Tfp pilus assembly protein PilN